jgi:pimeloyl-ACP methyl ester carboxylesterase
MLYANELNFAYDDSGNGQHILLLLHGLTANKHTFDGLLRAGLAKNNRVIRIDLRGRGFSDKPSTGYHMRDHANDLIGLIQQFDLQQVTLVGHSFGGLIAVYLAAHAPQYVSKLVLLDVGIDATYPDVLEKVAPSLRFLRKTVRSWEMYIRLIRKSPFFADGYWDDDLENFYRADVEMLEGGSIKPRAYADGMEEAAQLTVIEDWKPRFQAIQCPVLMLHASEVLSDILPMMSQEGAQETIALLHKCQYYKVPGHHISMLFRENASVIVSAIQSFLDQC